MKFYLLLLQFISLVNIYCIQPPAKIEKGKEKYDKCINENNITIGIIGNKNRGKSYLLGRIIGKNNYQIQMDF